jgi:hypothetical protein
MRVTLVSAEIGWEIVNMAWTDLQGWYAPAGHSRSPENCGSQFAESKQQVTGTIFQEEMQ